MTAPATKTGRRTSPNATPTRSRPGSSKSDVFAEDSGDIALSLPASDVPLAAPPLRRNRDVSSPIPQRLLSNGLRTPSHLSPRSVSVQPPSTESDMGERGPNTSGWRPPSPSPSPPTSWKVSEPSSSSSSSSTPLSSRRAMTRSRSLNVRIPSVDLSRGPRDVSSATATAPPALEPPDTNQPMFSPRPPPLIDDDTATRMSRWVQDIIVCNFDLERGPVVERRAGGKRWGAGVKENVAFSSFPDTSLFTEGDIQFSFKIRHVPAEASALAYPEPSSPTTETSEAVLPQARRQNTDTAAEYREWNERGREWLYGFVWFQQRRDRGVTRGYMQKSVVILTQLPFPALWSAVLRRLAPSFFLHGYSAIEVACHGIASWPDPAPDMALELPLLSHVINVKLPDETDNPQLTTSVAVHKQVLASLPPSTPLRAFASFLPSLWSLWECLVLAEPVLVIAPDPKTCSNIVWWLRELIRPIPLAGDFRPYLHIHDHDFSLLVNANKPQAGVVVGVTNPFFRNAASHWPNVISICGPKGHSKSGKGGLPDPPEGFLTRRHRSIQKDRVLLKRLEALVAEGKLDDPAGNAALRTHFQQLTEKFLVPLNRYFQTLVPPRSAAPSGASTPNPSGRPGDISQLGHQLNVHARGLSVPPPPPALSLSALRPFSLPTFLTHLKNHGPNPLNFKSRGLQTKARVESDFYASFCMGGCFAGWLAARVESLGIAVASSMAGDRLAGGLGTASRNLPAAGYEPDSASETSEAGVSTRTSAESGSEGVGTPRQEEKQIVDSPSRVPGLPLKDVQDMSLK